MREGDYLASIASSGPSARVTALLPQSIVVAEVGGKRDRIEQFIERSGIPLAPLCYIGLCVVASFFLFMLAIHIGPVTGVSVALVTLYLGVVFTPLELFGRRMRSVENELAGVAQKIGENLLRGHALDHSVSTTVQAVQSPELKEILQTVQRSLLTAASRERLGDGLLSSQRGGVLAGFLAAVRYAALHSHEEAGTLLVEYARIIEGNVGALRTYNWVLMAIRCVALAILAVLLCAASSTGFWSVDLAVLSLPSFARDLGTVVFLLSLVAVLRVTSLAEWERYGLQ